MYIYMDNFRGFEDTLIKLNNVNFLVGENSTGKSSVLAVLDLFSSQKFWFEQSFEAEEISFNHFGDIVSIFSKRKKEFSIGYMMSHRFQGQKNINCSSYLLTYTEFEGKPLLSEFFFTDGKYEAHIRFVKNDPDRKYKFLVKKLDADYKEEDIRKKIFSKWHKRKGRETSDYITFKDDKEYVFKRNSPHMIMIEIDMYLRKKNIISKSLNYIHPFLSIETVWLAPIRTKPRRTYDDHRLDFSPEGEHTPYLIKKILKSKESKKNFLSYINKVGKNSGLFETVRPKDYGDLPTSPFELDVLLNGKAISINNVGYGVSQSLPLFVEIYYRSKNCAFLIQQPEVHLHPKGQAALGSAIFDMAYKDNKRFFIETHSDYLIDRYRLNTRKSKRKNKPDAQILFFDRSAKGNKVTNIGIDENGDIPDKQPKKYRDFFVKESMKLLGLD